MDHLQGKQELERTKIIAILRGIKENHIHGVVDALRRGGITVLEITMNTPGALSMISDLQRTFADQLYIGAGTVLDTNDVKEALVAGAKFIVTPNTDEEAIRHCVSQGVPVYPGAMTPTEIVKAWKAGASAVKIFPSGSLGLGYLKELQGPLKHIPMIAVGGVNEDNIRQYIDIGLYATGIGSNLLNGEQIERGNYDWIADKARLMLERANTPANRQ